MGERFQGRKALISVVVLVAITLAGAETLLEDAVADETAFVTSSSYADESAAKVAAETEEELIQAVENVNGEILAVKPAVGPFHGNNIVTISGKYLSSGAFGDVSTVKVGNRQASKVLSYGLNSVVVRLGTAQHDGDDSAPGLADVEVISHALGSTLLQNGYEYKAPPLLLKVQPDNGKHSGHTAIALHGHNLCEDRSSVSVFVCDHLACGPSHAQACGCHDGRLTLHTPPASSNRADGGACRVRVSNSMRGEAVLAQGFTYWDAPEITQVTPTAGPLEGGNLLLLSGFGLTAGKGHYGERVTVSIGGRPATLVDFTPDTIHARVPHGLQQAGLVDVEVKSHMRGRATGAAMYTLHRPPRITSLSKTVGRPSGGELISIHARDVGLDIREVRFGAHRAALVDVTPVGRRHTLLRVRSPAFEPAEAGRNHSVAVLSASRGRATLPGGFRLRAGASVAAVVPAAGPSGGGTLVTIVGAGLATGLEDVSRVKLAGVDAAPVSVTRHQIVVRTKRGSPAASGGVELHTRSMGTIRAEGPSALFQYSKNAQITSVHPNQGSARGGDLLTIHGTGLCGDARCSDLRAVAVGGAHLATAFVHKSPRRIVVRTPTATAAGGPGRHTVRTVSDRVGEAAALDAFEFLEEDAVGRAFPHNGPLRGAPRPVEITGEDLGTGDEYNVLLAGVEAKVLSASRHKIVVLPGNAHPFARQHGVGLSSGLDGSILIEVRQHGRAVGMDSRIGFHYNPECSISDVSSAPAPVDGHTLITVDGLNLGMGDESILVNSNVAADPALTRRHHRGPNVHHISVLVPTSALAPSFSVKSLSLQSARSGDCKWQAPQSVGGVNKRKGAVHDASKRVSHERPPLEDQFRRQLIQAAKEKFRAKATAAKQLTTEKKAAQQADASAEQLLEEAEKTIVHGAVNKQPSHQSAQKKNAKRSRPNASSVGSHHEHSSGDTLRETDMDDFLDGIA